MTLKTYLKRPGAMKAYQLAEKIGISKGRLSQLRNSPWPPDLALEAERVTDGEINASSLSPVVKRARSTGTVS